jgi:hypothetical protein
MSAHQEASFWHGDLHTACITPLVFAERGDENIFGIGSGTGFFARMADDVYLITARHCLVHSWTTQDISKTAESLSLPFVLEGTTNGYDDLVQFESITQLAMDESQSEFLDVVALKVRKTNTTKHSKLLERAAKLPTSGLWLDKFVETPLAAAAIDTAAHLPFVVIGYPNKGTSTSISYADETGGSAEVQTQALIIAGNLRRSSVDHCLRLSDIHWPPGHEGLSGSPVFVKFGTKENPRSALAGMIICGSTKELNFIQISSIRRAIGSLKNSHSARTRSDA